MFFSGATVAADPANPNEDWLAATSDLLVLLDGATVRTETGCEHGAAWYTRKLGAAILGSAASRTHPLDLVLADAIGDVAALHPQCDLTHPGTPSAATGIVRIVGDVMQFLVLGDVTIALDTTDGVRTVTDPRVSTTAPAERAEADRHLLGSPQKSEALLAMKHGELAARNTDDGYWIAAADPAATQQAIVGQVELASVKRLAVLSDGGARYVDLFGLSTWARTLDTLAQMGPRSVIDHVRRMEGIDPRGIAGRRNKGSDDATIVYAEPVWSSVRRTQGPVNPDRSGVQDRTILDWMNRTAAATGRIDTGGNVIKPVGRR